MFFEITIMGNTAGFIMVQKTIIDALQKEGKSQRVITERGGCSRSAVSKHIKWKGRLEGGNWVGKCAQATGMTASLRTMSSKADSNTWESFTRSELKLESVHQESPRSDIFRKRATKLLLKQKQRQKHLTWAKEKKKRGCCSVVQSPLFVHFAFHLEIKVSESGGRVERHRIHVAWSPVWSFHSLWWFGLPCHLLVLVNCVFWSPQSTKPSTRTF